MGKIYKFDDLHDIIHEDYPEIPKEITGEWLHNALINSFMKHDFFRFYGFAVEDLSNYSFEDNIDYKNVRQISFSTKTKFPEKHPFYLDESLFHTFDNVRKLHEEGIDGSGISVAVIDQRFETIPDELEESLFYYNNLDEDAENAMHGTIVATEICGKNLGVAPKSKLYFYGCRGGSKNIKDNYLMALNDIYEKNLNGANIRVVNISATRQRENPKYEEVINKLLEQKCYVIDSKDFAKDFTSINYDSKNDEFYYSEWQLLNINLRNADFSSFMCVPTGGKMTPLFDTKSDYIYCGCASYSWSIPVLCGYFTLCLQLNPNLTYDEFVDIARKTSKKVDEFTICDINGIIEYLKNNIITCEHNMKR